MAWWRLLVGKLEEGMVDQSYFGWFRKSSVKCSMDVDWDLDLDRGQLVCMAVVRAKGHEDRTSILKDGVASIRRWDDNHAYLVIKSSPLMRRCFSFTIQGCGRARQWSKLMWSGGAMTKIWDRFNFVRWGFQGPCKLHCGIESGIDPSRSLWNVSKLVIRWIILFQKWAMPVFSP